MDGLQFAVRRAGLSAVAVALIGGIALYAHYGTVSPCGIIRQKARDAAAKEGGFVALIGAAVSDSVLDAIIQIQLGRVTPDRCLVALLNGQEFDPEPPNRTLAAQPKSVPQSLEGPIERNNQSMVTPPRPAGGGADLNWTDGKLAHLKQYIGTYKTDEVLDDPQVDATLDGLMSPLEKQVLRQNLDVRGPIEFIGNSLFIQGNRAHAGGSDTAIISIRLTDGDISAAVQHDGQVLVYSRERMVSNLPPPIYTFIRQKRGNIQ
jgi:hypothetical protein